MIDTKPYALTRMRIQTLVMHAQGLGRYRESEDLRVEPGELSNESVRALHVPYVNCMLRIFAHVGKRRL
jgi:hypothetical protein